MSDQTQRDIVARALVEFDWTSFATLLDHSLKIIATGGIDILNGTIESFPCCYTVGRMFRGLPELIISFPPDPALAREILQDIMVNVADLVDGQPIEYSQSIAIAPMAITSDHAAMYLTLTHFLHGMALTRETLPNPHAVPILPEASEPLLRAQQLVFSDDSGRFPWHPVCTPLFAQPKLWRLPAAEKHLS